MDKNVLIPVVLILVGIFLMTLPLTYTYISRFIEKIRMTPYDYYITVPETGEKLTLEKILGDPSRYPQDVIQNVYTLIDHYKSLGLSDEQIIAKLKEPICALRTNRLRIEADCNKGIIKGKLDVLKARKVLRCLDPIEIIKQPVDNDKGPNHYGYIYIQSAIRRIPDIKEKYGEKFYFGRLCEPKYLFFVEEHPQDIYFSYCVCLPRYLIGTSLDKWYVYIEIPKQDLGFFGAEPITKDVVWKAGPYIISRGPYFAQFWQNAISILEPPKNETEATFESEKVLEVKR